MIRKLLGKVNISLPCDASNKNSKKLCAFFSLSAYQPNARRRGISREKRRRGKGKNRKVRVINHGQISRALNSNDISFPLLRRIRHDSQRLMVDKSQTKTIIFQRKPKEKKAKCAFGPASAVLRLSNLHFNGPPTNLFSQRIRPNVHRTVSRPKWLIVAVGTAHHLRTRY